MKRFALLFTLALAVDVWAAEPTVAPTPAPSLSSKLLEFVSPAGLATLLGVIGSVIGSAAWLTAKRKRIVALAAYHAFHIVEDVGNEIDGEDGFDKTATYLAAINEYCKVNGWRPLKPGEVEAAKLQAQALHGAEIAKAKVAIAAAGAAAGPS